MLNHWMHKGPYAPQMGHVLFSVSAPDLNHRLTDCEWLQIQDNPHAANLSLEKTSLSKTLEIVHFLSYRSRLLAFLAHVEPLLVLGRLDWAAALTDSRVKSRFDGHYTGSPNQNRCPPST
jgi:hypothetical protein